MTFLIVALAAVVATLGIILFAVHRIRPRTLRFIVCFTRWFFLSLEVEEPQSGGTKRPIRGRAKDAEERGP